jgi:hypothetical protein
MVYPHIAAGEDSLYIWRADAVMNNYQRGCPPGGGLGRVLITPHHKEY